MIKLKDDAYRTVRGGWARMVEVACLHCGASFCSYQKDGGGPLRRLYIDRIIAPRISWKNEKVIACKKCKRFLGMAAVWTKERRKCFLVFEGTVKKSIMKMKD